MRRGKSSNSTSHTAEQTLKIDINTTRTWYSCLLYICVMFDKDESDNSTFICGSCDPMRQGDNAQSDRVLLNRNNATPPPNVTSLHSNSCSGCAKPNSTDNELRAGHCPKCVHCPGAHTVITSSGNLHTRTKIFEHNQFVPVLVANKWTRCCI